MLISIQDMLVEEEKQSAFYCILSDEKIGGFKFDGLFRFNSSTGEIFKSCSLYLRFPGSAY